MILTGAQIKEYGIIEPHVSRGVFNGLSYGESLAGYDIRIKEGFDTARYNNRRKHPFLLGSSVEHFKMPNDVVGLVKDKSTWARQGLSVFNTVIEPGWEGHLTLELFFANGAVDIAPGSPIAQVLFFRTGHTTGYDGKYQNQEDRPVEARFE